MKIVTYSEEEHGEHWSMCRTTEAATGSRQMLSQKERKKQRAEDVKIPHLLPFAFSKPYSFSPTLLA
jgi:hypothetical protein